MTTAAKGKKSAGRKLIEVHGFPDIDHFDVIGFTGTEQLCTPFQIHLEVLPLKSANFDLSSLAADLLGKAVSLTVVPSNSPADAKRRFEGEVVSVGDARWVEAKNSPTVILEIRPRLWRLSRERDTRLFTDKSVEVIVRHVLAEHSVSYSGLQNEGFRRPFTWQLGETDLEFVERLLEEEGYVYWFTVPEVGEHQLHISKNAQDLPILSGHTLGMGRLGKAAPRDGHVASLRRTVSVVPTSVKVRGRSSDGTSSLNGAATEKISGGVGVAKLTHGHAFSQTRCEQFARLELARLQASRTSLQVRTDVRKVTAGTVVAIRPNNTSMDESYRITAIQHEAQQSTDEYFNSFDAVAADAPFAIDATKQKPTLSSGLATVAGSPDENGAYPLLFDIDRLEQPSAPVSLGRDNDTLYLPRAGQRVEVGFVESDPDRPIIRRIVDPPGELPFDPSENQLLGGTFTPTHSHMFNHDPADPYVQMDTEGDFEDRATGERTVLTGKDREEFVCGGAEWSVGQDVNWKVEGSHVSEAGKQYSVQAETLTLAGKRKMIFAVGKSYIMISSAGITINGQPLTHINPPGARQPKKPIPIQGKKKRSKRKPKRGKRRK